MRIIQPDRLLEIKAVNEMTDPNQDFNLYIRKEDIEEIYHHVLSDRYYIVVRGAHSPIEYQIGHNDYMALFFMDNQLTKNPQDRRYSEDYPEDCQVNQSQIPPRKISNAVEELSL